MPTYQYSCTDCGNPLEAVQTFAESALTECPTCGGRLRKVYSAVGVVFKGSGFYRNDSRASVNGEGGKNATPKDGQEAGAASSGTKDKAPDSGAKDSGSKDSGGRDKSSDSAANGTVAANGNSPRKDAAPAGSAPKASGSNPSSTSGSPSKGSSSGSRRA